MRISDWSSDVCSSDLGFSDEQTLPSPTDKLPPRRQTHPDPHPGAPRMRTAHKTEFARHLRRTMTDAEREIWHHLRNRALMGHKFRRQYPVGPYIVDFACPARRLVVELDGGQHDEAVDAARTRYLERCG